MNEAGRREILERKAGSLGELSPSNGQRPMVEDNTEDIDVKLAKTRDEKVRAAGGGFEAGYYERAMLDRKESHVLGETSWSVSVRADRDVPTPSGDADRWARANTRGVTKPRTYAPLHALSGYSFGRSTMLAEEVAAFAALAGCPAAALVDRFGLTGAIEFAKACRRSDVKPLIGASIEVPEGGEIVLLVRSKRGYQNLSRLITECHLDEPRGFPLATWKRIERHSAGLLCLTGGDVGPLDPLVVADRLDEAIGLVERMARIFGRDCVYIEVERSFMPWTRVLGRRLMELSEATGIEAVAGGVVTHGKRSHFPAQDTLLCAESLCLVDEIVGRKERRHKDQPQVKRYPERSLNAERYLRSSKEMAALFADAPALLDATLRIADRCDDDVLPGRARLPSVFPDDGHALREIVESEAHRAYGSVYKEGHRARLKFEVDRILSLGFESHFLVAWDFVRWAREQGIGSSGRGSVVDSAVAYVLGFSEIDAIEHNLHFDRFLPADGTKRPDIDIDFEAARRDDIRGYLVRKYGPERVAGLAAIGSYRTRGIVRQVGKALGLPSETIGFLAKRIHGGVTAEQLESALEKRPELRQSNIPKERFRWVFELAHRLMDVPTGTRLHSSGTIVSAIPIRDAVPVLWSGGKVSKEAGIEEPYFRQIQWDKRSAKHVFDKFDTLCLRGQDVIGGVEARVRRSDPDFGSKHGAAQADPMVYAAMKSGELIGVPQSASPAMRQAHQRLRTNDLHEASMVQAGIRPGVGGAVKLNELIARRHGKEYHFEHPELEAILGHTYGIIVFQEQVDQLLQTFCGYTGGQAEDIRDAIYKKRKEGFADTVREQVVQRALANGYNEAVAMRVYEMVSQFNGYAFAQGHALAFAEVSLRSVKLMQEHPAEYFASLLSAQPAGYYGPVTIANEARVRGVKIHPLCVNRSKADYEVEAAVDKPTGLFVPSGAIRVGLRQLSGLSGRTRDRILELQDALTLEGGPSGPGPKLEGLSGGVAVAEREEPCAAGLRAFGSIFDFAAKVEPSRDELEALILSGAFDALHPNRRALMWSIRDAQAYARTLKPSGPNPCLPLDMGEPPIRAHVEDFTPQERALHERLYLGMDVERHLMAYERERVAAKGCLTTDEARRMPPGSKVTVVGNPIRLRFPPTSSGKRVVFWDLEDETGLINCTAFDETYQRCGDKIVLGKYCTIRGTIQDRGGHSAFLVSHAFFYEPVIVENVRSIPIATADFLVG